MKTNESRNVRSYFTDARNVDKKLTVCGIWPWELLYFTSVFRTDHETWLLGYLSTLLNFVLYNVKEEMLLRLYRVMFVLAAKPGPLQQESR